MLSTTPPRLDRVFPVSAPRDDLFPESTKNPTKLAFNMFDTCADVGSQTYLVSFMDMIIQTERDQACRSSVQKHRPWAGSSGRSKREYELRHPTLNDEGSYLPKHILCALSYTWPN